jgi:hypothetical protein
MSPITHCLAGWLLANTAALNRRERGLVTLAAVIPDADAAGLLVERLTRHSAHPLLWWSQYHHVLGHNLGFALLAAAAAFGLARQRWKTAWLALASFHLHLLADLVGARGPDGEQWPIFYLWPFSSGCKLTWSGQWGFNAWPNFLLTALLLSLTFYLAWKRGYSVFELVWPRLDAVFVGALRRRFGQPAHQPSQTHLADQT